MTQLNKRLFRLAIAIQAALEQKTSHPPILDLPDYEWARCRRLAQHIRYAERRGWQAAAAATREMLRVFLDRVCRNLTDQQVRLNAPPKRVVRLREIYDDLIALKQEFETVDWDQQAGTLSVTTTAITLEGRYLGAFCIELEWRRLDRSQPYRVVALDPRLASANDSVTHPHVRDGELCEGDGSAAIKRALASGRLYDFFSLVSSILHTYNSSSPFIALEQWEGVTCSDCGTCCDEDESSSCCNCESTICYACREECYACGDSHCAACLSHCAMCEELFCSGCLERCAECQSHVCKDCISKNQTCENCDEQEPEETDSPPVSVAAS